MIYSCIAMGRFSAQTPIEALTVQCIIHMFPLQLQAIDPSLNQQYSTIFVPKSFSIITCRAIHTIRTHPVSCQHVITPISYQLRITSVSLGTRHGM